jgi:hypothetical protein
MKIHVALRAALWTVAALDVPTRKICATVASPI